MEERSWGGWEWGGGGWGVDPKLMTKSGIQEKGYMQVATSPPKQIYELNLCEYGGKNM